MKSLANAKAEPIGHLGFVGGVLQDTEIMAKIDEQLGEVTGGLNYGYRVGAMLWNGLGFINTALYMRPRYFHDKRLSRLLGADIQAEQLNDDSLGRCLDKIARYGVSRWYSEIVLEVVQQQNLLSQMVHLDSTTLTWYGDDEVLCDESSPKPMLGYSKDHRPDLKQVTLPCVTLGKSALPFWIEALNGNRRDNASFPETIKRVDAFYSKSVIKGL